jgi:hypothetical protein
MVGYWAESRILGGVVLFDRRELDAEPCVEFGTDFKVDPDAIFFHPDREGITYRICQLLPEQRKALLDFLIAEPSPPSPFPILPSKDNRIRVCPEDPITMTGIYRDIWERKEIHPPREWVRRCVVDTFNYPSRNDWYNSGVQSRMWREKYEEEHLWDDEEEPEGGIP